MSLVRRLGVAFVVTFALGLLLSVLVRIDLVADVDGDATRWLHESTVERSWLSSLSLDVTSLGDPLTLTAFVVIAVVWLLVSGHGGTAVWLAAVTAAASVTGSLLKVVVARARPDFDSVLLEPTSRSFPSGHAMHTTVTLGAITVAVVSIATARRGGAVTTAVVGSATVALAVGVTRPLLGVHFVSDVVAGWTLGVVWLLLVRRRRSSGERAAESEEPN